MTVLDERLARFTRTERAVHWVQAASFLVLLVSGFGLSLPSVEAILGNRDTLREIHLSAAFFLFFGPAIVALSGDRASVARDVQEVDTWSSDDLRWLIPFRRRPVPQGRFNAGQKLNAIFVAWSTLTFTATGLVMWQNRRFPIDLVAHANTIHSALAYVALLAFLGHLSLATLYPGTRHSLHAIVQGWVRSDWAREHHPLWARTAPPFVAGPPGNVLLTTVRLLLASAIALFAARAFFFWLGANPTDRVIGWVYTLTAWPGAGRATPATGVHIADWPALVYFALLLVAWKILARWQDMPSRS